MTGFHEVRFPDNIAYGATGGPEFATTVVVTGAGLQRSVREWAMRQGLGWPAGAPGWTGPSFLEAVSFGCLCRQGSLLQSRVVALFGVGRRDVAEGLEAAGGCTSRPTQAWPMRPLRGCAMAPGGG